MELSIKELPKSNVRELSIKELSIKELSIHKERVPTLCLNMIVKNESKIITRMFDAVVDIIDCYCICDTGSTDNTIQIITDYFAAKEITGKIMNEPFKNFAHNRNVALQGCKGMSDYVLLLDADMILKISDKFVKSALTLDYYHIFQGNESFYYQNTRIVRNNGLFSYLGVTHEHMNAPPRNTGFKVFDKRVIFILDVGDGGAKSDKFKRDIALLEKGIEDEPSNTRYYFYLGNSYRDFDSADTRTKAIETYKKLLDMNGWAQEKYCACISLGNIYFKNEDKSSAAKFWLKSSEYDHERIEGVVKAAEHYRVTGENVMVNLLYNKYKGYKRNLAEGKLFVEQDKYRDILEYNNSICAYYVNDRDSGYACCKQILLNSIMDNVSLKSTLENMRFYKDYLEKESKEEREKLFVKVDCLLDKLQQSDKNTNEVWQLLNTNKRLQDVAENKIIITEVIAPVIINIEEVYQQIKQLRIDAKSEQAYELYKSIPKDHPKYSEYFWQLEYEYSVFAYYIGVRNINDQVVTIMNKCTDDTIITSVLSNMKFYPDILKADKVYDFTHTLKHTLNDVEYTFNSSSSCIIPYNNNGYLLNIRLVNYRIDNDSNYVDCDKHIISMYKCLELTKEFTTINERLLVPDYVDRRYIGIEDVRFFKQNDGSILFTGTGYHINNTVGITNGIYSDDKLSSIIEPNPAFNPVSTCEKNWVYVDYKDETHMIYNWFPLKICKVNNLSSLLELVEERTMPPLFKLARGSSCLVTYNDERWVVVHLVSYEKPRYYYHIIAVFDDNMNLLRYSAPFKFGGECIEYCIGLVVESDRVIIPYSSMDRTTKVGIYDKKYIEDKLIYNYGMKLLTTSTDYKETIKLALNIDIANNAYTKPVIFHCYWNGQLNEKHVISIKSCYFFNVLKHTQNKIILWIENNSPNEHNAEIKKYADIKYFSLNNEIKETFLENKHFNFNSITFYSDYIRTFLLYKYGGCWFDLDCFFLRSFKPLFNNYRNEICTYQWEKQNYPNNAIYISLEPYSDKMKRNIEFIIHRNKGWGFQEANLTYDLPLDMLVLPCSWFDGCWISNPYNLTCDDFFKTTDKTYNFDIFFKGAFCYHWHNRWNTHIEPNSIIKQLDDIIICQLNNSTH